MEKNKRGFAKYLYTTSKQSERILNTLPVSYSQIGDQSILIRFQRKGAK
jgi:hypothetical protein